MQNSTILSENPVKTLTETSTEIQIFENSEFGKVRTTVINNEPYFVGKEIAEILGYANPNEAIAEHIEEEDKLHSKTLSSFELNLGQRGGWLVNESGLYSLILSSKLPSAKKFKHWVTSVVLPSIRKNGGYINNQENLSDDEIMAKGLLVAQKIIAEKNQKLLEMTPKAEFYDKVTGSADTHDMKEVAKILNFKNVGRNTLFEILRNEKILDKNNQPYQRYVDAGYFRIIESKWEDSDGDTHINLKTVVYQKGIDYIRKTVLKNPIYLNNAIEDAAEKWIEEND